MRRGWSEYLPEGTDPRDPLASPLFAEDVRGVAPAFVLTAEYDTLRDEGEAYAWKLIQAGNLVQARRYPGTIHGFFTMQGELRVAREAMGDAAAFLRRNLTDVAGDAAFSAATARERSRGGDDRRDASPLAPNGTSC
jgi:acetyl esterase